MINSSYDNRNVDSRLTTYISIRKFSYASELIIAGGCDTMGKAIEICTGLGISGSDYGQSVGRRDALSRYDEVPEAHIRILHS